MTDGGFGWEHEWLEQFMTQFLLQKGDFRPLTDKKIHSLHIAHPIESS